MAGAAVGGCGEGEFAVACWDGLVGLRDDYARNTPGQRQWEADRRQLAQRLVTVAKLNQQLLCGEGAAAAAFFMVRGRRPCAS